MTFDVCEVDEVAATIPSGYLKYIRTHGDAVVLAKNFVSDDATRQEIDNLAGAIERRAKCRTSAPRS